MNIATAEPSHELFIPRESNLRGMLAYDDTTKFLYVEETSMTSIEVMEYMAELERHDFRFERVSITSDELRDKYRSKASGEADNSRLQNSIINLIRVASKDRVSDVHIVVDHEKTVIKYRQLGRLCKVPSNYNEKDGMEILRTIYSTMSDNADIYLKEKEKQDARLSAKYVSELGLYGGRIATTPTDKGMLMVIRLFYSSDEALPELGKLGYSNEQVLVLKKMIRSRLGLCLISGVTGSGKTTTLEKIMKVMIAESDGKKNFITVENPPENDIPGANQTPVLCEDFNDDSKVSQSWGKSIANLLRLDPDVIMVGEIRDVDSAKAAVHSANTGHLVFSTVHAFDAVAILDRLIYDMGLIPSQILNYRLVKGLVNQSLIPVLCPSCKVHLSGNEHIYDDPAFIARVKKVIPDEENYKHICVTGAGCAECNETGLSGRTVIAEIIHPDRGFMNAYRTAGANEAREYWLKHLNGKSKKQDLIERIIKGDIDPKVAEEEEGDLDED